MGANATGDAGTGTGADGIRIEAVSAELLPTYRDVRIAALIDSPRAFWTTYRQASTRTDDAWTDWLADGPRTWLAFARDSPVGTVGLWHRVVLEVAHENERAWAFHCRMGFRPTGETGTMPWDTSVTEELMVLDLAPRP